MQFDDELRKALRAEDPGAAFTQRVLARAREQRAGREAAAPPEPQASGAAPVMRAGSPADAIGATGPIEATVATDAIDTIDARRAMGTRASSSASSSSSSPSPRVKTMRWVAAGVAASIALAAGGLQWKQHLDRIEAGERARAQVLAALRITSEKLNLVHDRITEPAEAR